MNKRISGIVLILGVIVTLITLSFNLYYDSYLWKNETVIFTDGQGNRIFNKYYPGTTNTGVMLFHGFGGDLNSMRTLALRFKMAGYHVFATDFSGHGSSSGILSSSETNQNTFSNQVILAKEQFKNHSGLTDNNIYLLGHSMGARAILQASVLNASSSKGLILLGAAVFASVNITVGTWEDTLGPYNPNTNVLIITGTWEDVFTPQEARELYTKLTNEIPTTNYENSYIPFGFSRGLAIIDNVPHAYEPMCTRIAAVTTQWIDSDVVSLPCSCYSSNLGFRKLMIIFESIGIMSVGIFGSIFLNQIDIKQYLRNKSKVEEQKDDQKEVSKLESINEQENNNLLIQFKINNFKEFFLFKPLIYIAGMLLSTAISVILLLIPIGSPFFTFIYFIPILGYGLIAIILYLVGKMPGTTGKLKINILQELKDISGKQALLGLACALFLILISQTILNSIYYKIFPANIRLLWLTIFSLLIIPGFFMIQKENEEIKNSGEKMIGKLLLNNLILFIPFLLILIYLGASGSIIYFFDGLHSIAIIVYVWFVGEILYRIWKSSLLSAIIQSFLLFWLLLPRGPLTMTF